MAAIQTISTHAGATTAAPPPAGGLPRRDAESPSLARVAAGTARAFLAVAAIGALLAGCGTASIHDGPEPPEQEVAALEGYWYFNFFVLHIVRILSVDGKPATESMMRVKLSPGRHSIGLRVDAALLGAGISSQCTFEDQFERGHRYRIESFDNYTSRSEIGLEVKTIFGDSATTRSIPCRRSGP